MIKTKTWVCLIFSIFLLSVAIVLSMQHLSHAGTIANIYVDGKCVRSVDLAAVKESEQFILTCTSGSNTILVEPGRIRITDADCPDQICVTSGWLENGAVPIVCLPHRLVIRLESASADTASNIIDTISK